jgi:hypothetical protein
VVRDLAGDNRLAVLTRGQRALVLESWAKSSTFLRRSLLSSTPAVLVTASWRPSLLGSRDVRGLSPVALDGRELRDLGAFATLVAAVTVGRPGADPPTLEEAGFAIGSRPVEGCSPQCEPVRAVSPEFSGADLGMHERRMS